MGQFRKDPAEKREASDKGLGELMDLFLKLNSKLREKISPRPKEEKGNAENIEMVIIILNRSSENTSRTPRPERPKLPKPNWINQLCEDIEREGGKETSP
jgi:hypothetical protein